MDGMKATGGAIALAVAAAGGWALFGDSIDRALNWESAQAQVLRSRETCRILDLTTGEPRTAQGDCRMTQATLARRPEGMRLERLVYLDLRIGERPVRVKLEGDAPAPARGAVVDVLVRRDAPDTVRLL